MTKTFSGNDILLIVVLTVILGLLLIAISSHLDTESLLVGLGAMISALWVRVRVLQREMAQLKVQLHEKQGK